MSFFDFIKNFFCFKNDFGGNYLDTTHIILASIVSLITIFLGVFFGIRHRDRDERAKTKFILPFAITMWSFHLVRMVMIVVRTYASGGNGWFQLLQCDLPLFLCDIQYFALVAICFAKGRLKKAGLDFCLCLGILSFAMGVWLNAGTYSGTAWWTSSYIYEMVVHAIPGGLSLYIAFSKSGSLKLKDIWVTFLILLVFEAIALTLDYTIDSNYMFFKSDAGTPFSIFANWAKGNTPLYSFFVWCGMTVYVALYYSIWELVAFIVGKIKQSKRA
ncbi:MAG: YwaF family protein [Bacilli bacterium]|nr:YwaF family protein [Bacilli bacterium]